MDVLTWDEPSRPVSIAIETSKNEILSTLRNELWDLNKNITEDFQYYALYNEANNHLLETMNNVSSIVVDWANNRVTKQLFDTLGMDWPEDRPPYLIKPIAMRIHEPIIQPYGRTEPWNMTFVVMTARINKFADVRKIDAFTLYENNASLVEGYDWCKIQYIGPPAVVTNGPTCKVEFANRVDEQTYVGTQCTSKILDEKEVTNRENYELWQKECYKESFKPFRPEAQIKTINDRNYIYCPNYTISYSHLNHPNLEVTMQCPEHVFSFPISTSFTLKEVNYRFDGLEEHLNTSNKIQEEEIQKLVSSFIIPNRNFAKELKPVNITTPYFYSYIKYFMWGTGIILTAIVIIYIWKCIFMSGYAVHHRIQVMRRERKRVKDLINYHDELKKQRHKKHIPSAPQLPMRHRSCHNNNNKEDKCHGHCHGRCQMDTV